MSLPATGWPLLCHGPTGGMSDAHVACPSFKFGRCTMADDPIEPLLDAIRTFAGAMYARGERDTLDRILKAAQTHETAPPIQANGSATPEATKDRRAPPGAAREFVDSVLFETKGASPKQLFELATSRGRTVSYGAIRKALQKGRKDHSYINRNGKWYLSPQRRAEARSEH
jgi:hypothetical protein